MDARVLFGPAHAATSRSQRTSPQPAPLLARLWIYQRERFPLLGHGLLIAAFSSSAVSFSCLLRGGEGLPAAGTLAVAFISSFFFFFQLRVADEFKDYQEDGRWRPYRPVPRGLVKLGELAAIAGMGALIQLVLGSVLSWRLSLLLLLVWAYLALMTREFFVRDWIVARPVTYLWTHMLIIPLADFYATACDWTRAGGLPPTGLFWFLAVSFCNGVTLELGRKIRAPAGEEEGVRTYSMLWGRRKATLAWLGALGATAVCVGMAAARIQFLGPGAAILGPMLLLASWLARQFIQQPTARGAKWLEQFSGLWTIAVYLMLGVVPMLLKWGKALP